MLLRGLPLRVGLQGQPSLLRHVPPLPEEAEDHKSPSRAGDMITMSFVTICVCKKCGKSYPASSTVEVCSCGGKVIITDLEHAKSIQKKFESVINNE